MEFKRLSKLHKYGMAISFLAMEIFALMAFSFGDNYVLYGSLSLALMVLLVLFNIKQITVDGISSIAYLFLPLFLFTLVCAIGFYFRPHAIIGDYKVAELVMIPLGLLPMCFAGYMLSIDRTFKLPVFLIVVYSALGVITLINLFANIVNFGFFYTIFYKGYHMYYGGVISDVTVDQMAYTLEGFKFIEVKMAHYILYPSLLLTSVIALPFMNPKENLKTFILYAVFAFVGLVSLVFVPSTLGLISGGMIILIGLVIFLLKKFTNVLARPAKYAIYILFILGLLLFLVMFLNNQSKLGIANAIASNSLLNRLFNSNRFVSRYNTVMQDVIYPDRYLGFAAAVGSSYGLPLSGSVLFDSCMMAGLIGPIAVIFIFFFGFKGFRDFFKHSDEKFYVKALLVGFASFATIFFNVIYEAEYGIYYSIMKPAIMTGPFMILVFILSFVLAKGAMSKPKEKVPEVKEEANNA